MQNRRPQKSTAPHRSLVWSTVGLHSTFCKAFLSRSSDLALRRVKANPDENIPRGLTKTFNEAHVVVRTIFIVEIMAYREHYKCFSSFNCRIMAGQNDQIASRLGRPVFFFLLRERQALIRLETPTRTWQLTMIYNI